MRRISGILVLLTTLAGSSAFAQRGGWWQSAWKARRTVTAPMPEGVTADEPTGTATFMTHGLMKSDGSDLRVVAKGKEVPRRVLRVGPGDAVTVAFQLVPTSRDRYHVYYGNPKATAPTYDWEIRAGVLLEVRKYRGGSFNNLRQAQATWRRSKDVLGRAFVPNVFLGHNPFGKTGAFMSHYVGWLVVTEPGEYVFATTSTNGSFLLIDGKQVVSWPGWHGPAPRARRRGTITLKAGRSRLEYYHIHPGGGKWGAVAVAAWQPPGTRRPVVIPARAFLPVAEGVVQPAETHRQSITPDFTLRKHEAFLDPERETFLHRYAFTDVTQGLNRRYYRPLWDFGDGVTATVWMPDHVYLAAGTYTVTYALKGTRGTVTTRQRIVVERDWSQQASRRHVEDLKRYAETVKGYDFAKMPPASLSAACEMFERLKAYDDAVRVGRTLVRETKDVGGTTLFAVSRRVARIAIERLRRPATAVEALLAAERKITDADDLKAQLAVEVGTVTLERLRDPARARGHFARALSAYPRATSSTRRRALIGLGESAVLQGDADEARKRLAAAERIRIDRGAGGSSAVRVGSLSRAVEDYVRRNEFAAAKELLDTWEWEFPLDRLAGYSTLLRAKLHLTRSETDRATLLLMTLVKVNPRSNYAAEALMTAADCFRNKGDKPRARDTYSRVLAEYPESPFVKKALREIEKLK